MTGCSVLSLHRGCTLLFYLEKFLEHQSKYNVHYNIRLLPADAKLIIALYCKLHNFCRSAFFSMWWTYFYCLCVFLWRLFFSRGHMMCVCFGLAPYTNL